MKELWWRIVDYVRYIFGRETRDAAWSDGYRQSEADGEADYLHKEAFIAECGAALNDVATNIEDSSWRKLTPQTQEFLRDFL